MMWARVVNFMFQNPAVTLCVHNPEEGGVMRPICLFVVIAACAALSRSDSVAGNSAKSMSRSQRFTDSLLHRYHLPQLGMLPSKMELPEAVGERVPQGSLLVHQQQSEILTAASDRMEATNQLQKAGARGKVASPDTLRVHNVDGLSRFIYTYNSLGLISVRLHHIWRGGTWVDEDRVTYSYTHDGLMTSLCHDFFPYFQPGARISKLYNTRGQMVSSRLEWWVGEKFELFVHDTSEFDSEGRELLQLREFFDKEVVSEWYRNTREYEQRRCVKISYESWNAIYGGWGTRCSFVYGSGESPIAWTAEEKIDDAWRRTVQCEISYTVQGSINSILMRSFVSGEWVNSELETWESGSNYAKWHLEKWLEGAWIPYQRWTHFGCGCWESHEEESIGEESVGGEWRRTAYDKARYSSSGVVLWEIDSSWCEGQLQMCLFATHDESGNALEDVTEQWQDGALQFRTRVNYSYDDLNVNLRSIETDSWSANEWIPGSRELYSYDAAGRLRSLQFLVWETGQWRLSDRSGDRYTQWAFTDNAGNQFEEYGFLELTFSYRGDVSTGVHDHSESLAEPGLAQNYPNPFNPATTIRYSVGVVSGQSPVASSVRLSVYDLLGREVEELVNGKKESGSYEAKFNGEGLPSGVYIARLTIGDFSQSRRMVLVR
jgi:hypothetical protein